MGGGGEREVLHRPSLGLSLRASCIHSCLELAFYLGNSLPISRRLGRLEGSTGFLCEPPAFTGPLVLQHRLVWAAGSPHHGRAPEALGRRDNPRQGAAMTLRAEPSARCGP
jgi:hypothetical protein